MTLIPMTIHVPPSLKPTESEPLLIGIVGRPYAGKDTVAQSITTRYGFAQGAFGDQIKVITMQLYGLSLAQVTTKLKDRIDPRWGKTPRELLQHTGRCARQAAPDVWVRNLFTPFVHPLRKTGQPVVISDVRDQIEVDAIRAAGGILWRVERPEATFIAQQNGMTHASSQDSLEQGLADVPVDGILRNDGSIKALDPQIDRLLAASPFHAALAAPELVR